MLNSYQDIRKRILLRDPIDLIEIIEACGGKAERLPE